MREFNSGYDWFQGMSAEEILAAQSPLNGWASQTRAFRPDAGIDEAPRWADFANPLEAINARARARKPQARADGHVLSGEERSALDTLGLGLDVDKAAVRKRYYELVRRYHPDRNGGDRTHEVRLNRAVQAYQLLRKSAAFAR